MNYSNQFNYHGTGNDIIAIDVHAHYGKFFHDDISALAQSFSSGDAQLVVKRAQKANTDLTIVSPLKSLLPRGKADAFAGNYEAANIVSGTKGLLQYAVLNPLQPSTYKQCRELLQSPYCVGLKIHPEEHCYSITEYGGAIFTFAENLNTIVLTHSGERNSMPEDFVPFLNQHQGVTLILAHLGCGYDGSIDHQVRAIQECKNSKLFVDTSSTKSLYPGIIEWAVKEIGAERILYGTDSPLYFAPFQRARIDYAEITERQKKLILRENAEKLFQIN